MGVGERERALELEAKVAELKAERDKWRTQAETYERYWQAAEKRADVAENATVAVADKHKALKDMVTACVPYVISSLPYPSEFVVRNTNVTTSHPDWIAVHRGRARSSYNQLNLLLKTAKGEEA